MSGTQLSTALHYISQLPNHLEITWNLIDYLSYKHVRTTESELRAYMDSDTV